MDKTYQTTGKIFEQASKLYSPGMLEELRSIKHGEIVVVTGQYDHVEKLLEPLKVPYEIIAPENMATHNGGRVMFVNCRTYQGCDKKIVQAVKSFVEDGGRVITTDWSIDLAIAAFPGKYQKTAKTGDDVVEIACPTDLARKFIGMNYAQCKPEWWLEGSSDIYDIIDKSVTAIITSPEMEEKYGKKYVAAGFRAGDGEALHFISHLELQRTKQSSKGKGNLDDFLKKMEVERTTEMEDEDIANLEAAYSTLNTVAYLCLRSPVLEVSTKSMLVTQLKQGNTGSGAGTGTMKSTRLV